MNIGAVTIMIIVMVVVTLLFAWGLQRTYMDKLENSKLTSIVAVGALSVTLLCVLLIPVDIYIVSSNLNHDGSQSNPELTKNSSAGLQNFYYALYIALLAFAFLFVPFAYFWFEEDSEEDSTPSSSGNRRGSALEPLSPRSASGASSKRFCGALKYTSGFIVFFFVLLALGLVLKKGHQDDESDWRNRLSNDFTGAEAILSFCIGCLSCIGLMAYVVYAAYGLARMPLKLMAKAKAAKLKKASLPTSGPKASSRAEDVEVALLKNKENMEFLEAKYQSSSPSSPSNRAWSAEDMKKKNALRKEQRDLMQQRNASQRQGIAIQARAARNEKLTCWDKCWNALVPFRMALGIPLLLVSFLLISSITISVVDKFKHSSCGPSCGYSLAKTHIINPIDESFRAMNEVFPIDCIFFALLVLYIFLACVSGMVGLGVRFFFVHLYPIQKGRTLPNAFLMAAWLLQLMVLVINMQVSVIAPSYATFGNQYWLNETSQEKVACDTHLIGVHPNHCVQTQLGKFLNTMAVETPFFSVILFYGNLAFLAFFVLFLAHGVFVADNGAKEATDEFRALQEESDEEI